MRTLIVNGEAALHAHLHQLREDRQHPDAIGGTTNGAPAVNQNRGPARSFWPPRIIGEKSGRFYFLDANEVEYLASAGNYVIAHLGAHEYLTRTTLKSFAEQLAPLGFIQINRSLLVNLRQVAHVERRDRGQFGFVMRTGARLVSSRERHASIRDLLLGITTPQSL